MSGPLPGIGAGQIQPQVTTFQPGRNTEVRQEQAQREQVNDTTLGQGSNGVEELNTTGQVEASAPVSGANESGAPTELATNSSGRGANVNILV